ncbi:winged helix-turn-helix domain-containing protein [Streptomycetaceae bacterium NBC_01309]
MPETLVRPRLNAQLDAVLDRRPVLLTATAGHGKTTLLDQYAATWAGRVRRIRCGPGDDRSAREICADIGGSADDGDALVVVDDLHHLPHAAEVFESLAAAARPPRLLVGTRPVAALNLSRAELAHTVVIGADDLRLRWWEVDRLFTDVHGRPPDPVLAWDATWLTGGWAAPLHEYLLCTRDLSARQARLTLTAPGVPFAAGYLDRQILDGLDPDLVAFLTRTAIMNGPTAANCAGSDSPAARAEAAAMLRRAERAGVLVRKGAEYVGEILLRHLLVHRFATTDPAAQGVFAAAVRPMREAGDPVGAAWAAYLARDRTAIRELMDRNPLVIAAAVPEHWHGMLRTLAGPARPVDRQAARMVAGDSEVFAEPEEESLRASAEAINGIMDGPLRLADVPELPRGAEGEIVRAVALMGTGDYRAAIAAFDAYPRELDGPPVAAAELFGVLAALLAGHGCDVRVVEQAAQRVAMVGPVWLARIARAGLTLTGADEYRREAGAVRVACERLGDAWGAALAGHMDACAGILRGEPDPAALDAAARGFAAAGMTAAAPWALAFGALARAQLAEPGAGELALRAEAEAVRWELPGASVIARCARLLAEPATPGSDYDTLVADAERLGIHLHAFLRSRRDAGAAPAAPVDIRCFGGFTVRLGGRPLDLLTLTPQSRVLFRLLALHAGRPVHREVLAAAMWPDAPADAAFHRLQTAVYKLRRFLEPGRGRRGASEFVPFEDGAYRLRLPEGSYLDIAAAEDALARARQAAARGDVPGETRILRELLAVADAILLPETGPEEWVVGPRDRWLDAATEARYRLAVFATM